MFDSHLNWNYSNNIISAPWILPAANVNTEGPCHTVVQVQTQSSSFAANPEGSLLSTNTIEWFASGNPQLPCQPQTIGPAALLNTENYKSSPETALVSYNGNSSFLNTSNTLLALPAAPATQATIPAILTLTVPGLEFQRSVVLQAPTASLFDPTFCRSSPAHDQSTYMTRITRNISLPIPDAYAVIQGAAGQLLPTSNVISASPCIRLPFTGGPALPAVSAITEPHHPTTSQSSSWVMVLPSKSLSTPENKVKVPAQSYVEEINEICSSCGVEILPQSSLSQEKKCSTCLDTNITVLPQITASNIQVEIVDDAASKDYSCSCYATEENPVSWKSAPCEKCSNISSLTTVDNSLGTFEADATCQVITTTTVEASNQASSEIEPCLEAPFDSEHEEFEPTSQAINSILRKLLEDEIHGKEIVCDEKSLDVFGINDDNTTVQSSTLIDLNTETTDDCDIPSTGVKDVLMSETPSSRIKRRVNRIENVSKKRCASVSVVPDSPMKLPACSECGHQFSSTLSLRKHYMDQVNDKSYECEKCKQTFTGCYSYKRHSWTHDRKLSPDDNLETGMFSESSEEEIVQPYGCAQCGKEFSDCFLLTEHCATHVKGKPFTCTQCDMCFENVGLLEKHAKLHVRTKTVLFNGYEAESESSASSNE